ncbi:class II glutamine amidotransferase [Streptomyces sp. TBY4]|uniref:class II glutamine amidotransferase n=1 Tax=Streptomyces sp. TBY4 TaxID=2962030 RepID=UPI0020B8948B|nr:class II glutamine amidotransferase [Streptomyces sp. TBY4]MCP3759377.1 class II glutamine amidotransferase [Streptomyces sp. TBY4]
MCRLFALTTCGPRVQASHWLLDSLSSFREQSRKQPDGTGFGWFSLGDEPVRDRSPIGAFKNDDFADAAEHVVSHTVVSHVRYGTRGEVDVHNCHPFDIHDRLFAHNGCIRGVETIDSWLTDVDRAHIEGATDSETVFAFISAEIQRLGDTTEGIISAVKRMAAEIPIFSLNFVLAEPRRLWALRYPANAELWVLNPDGGGFGSRHRGARPAGHRADGSWVADGEEEIPAWVVASERLDADPDWRLLEPGELLVIADGKAVSQYPFDPPAHHLTLDDLRGVEVSAEFRDEDL